MTRQGKTFSSLSKLSRQSPSLAEVLAGFSARKHSDDRALAITESAHLESNLEDALLFHMGSLSAEESNALFRDQGPIGSFSAKIMIGQAMGVYGRKTREELDRIRRIRNAFAHARKPIRFDTEAVAAACQLLITPGRIPRPHTAVYAEQDPWPPSSPRQMFMHTTNELSIRFAAFLFPGLPLFPGQPERPILPLD